MQQYNYKAAICLPCRERQKRLHRQLAGFAGWMQRPKDAAQLQSDQRKSVPVALLPMVF